MSIAQPPTAKFGPTVAPTAGASSARIGCETPFVTVCTTQNGLPNVPDNDFTVVDGPADIPVPRDGDGIWIHPVEGRLHVHAAVPNGELNLER